MSFRSGKKERIEAIINAGTTEQRLNLISSKEINKLNINELKELAKTDGTVQTSLFDALISTPNKLEKMLPTFVEYGNEEMRKKVWNYVKTTVDQSELLALLKSNKIAKGTVNLLDLINQYEIAVGPSDRSLNLLRKVTATEEDEKNVSLLKSDMAGAVILMLLFDNEIAKDFLNWINDPALLKISVSTKHIDAYIDTFEVGYEKNYLVVDFAKRSDELRLAVLNTIERLGAYDVIKVKDLSFYFGVYKYMEVIDDKVYDVKLYTDRSTNYVPLSSVIVADGNEKVISEFLGVLENVKNRDKLLRSKLRINSRFYTPDSELASLIVQKSMKATGRVADVILEWAKDNPSILNLRIEYDIPLSDIVNITGEERQKYYDKILRGLKDNPYIYASITIPDEVYLRWLEDKKSKEEYIREWAEKSNEEYIREWAEGSQDVELSLFSESRNGFSFADIVAIIGEGTKLLPFINTKGAEAAIDAINKYGTPEIKEELTKNLRDGKKGKISNIIEGIVKIKRD